VKGFEEAFCQPNRKLFAGFGSELSAESEPYTLRAQRPHQLPEATGGFFAGLSQKR
jgi:hypothetical protein